jgi:predicted alpha-1,6-mannanase (GH76 family)/fibronectin type 3 domain-containing protein
MASMAAFRSNFSFCGKSTCFFNRRTTAFLSASLFLRGWFAFSFAWLVAGSGSVQAFTSANADTLISAYYTKFYVQDTATRGHFKNTETSGTTYFWGQAEEIEGVIDAYERTSNSFHLTRAVHLLNGFANTNGTNWGGNIYNDDIMWACIAHLRVYLHDNTQTTFRSRAKTNFDLAYARGWDAAGGGGFWWTTDETSKVTAVNCPAAIVAYLIYLAYGDSSYLTKSQEIFDWSKANLWNSATGQVYDSPTNFVPTTYNQGTFVGAADFLGDNASALLVCTYTTTMGSATWNGHDLMPMYGIDGNNSGFNGIGLRWICKFLLDNDLEGDYLGWLQTNANAAWNVRRTTDNLSWCEWHNPSPTSEVFHSWDCISSVVALQVIPTDVVPSAPTNLAGAFTGGTIVLNWGKQASYSKTYTVKRATAFGGPYTTIASNLAAVSYTDTDIQTGTTYYYVVAGTNDAGTGPDSQPLMMTEVAGSKLTGTIIGTDGAFGGGSTNTKFKVYDGLLNTYFDSPNASGDWAGLDLGAGNEKVITRIRYSPRNSSTGSTSNAARMVGGKFQGANQADFSDAVTLFTAPGIPPYNVYTIGMVNNPTAFRYVRYLSPNGGQCNVSEVEFYSQEPFTPEGLLATASGSSATLSWGASPSATHYLVKRSTVPGGPYTTLDSNVSAPPYVDSTLSPDTVYYYVVSAMYPDGESPDSEPLTLSNTNTNKLTGTIIGTNGSWANSGHVKENVYDGMLNTYFDSPNDNGDWAGLDLGAGNEKVITRLRYSPRNSSTGSPSNANRMIGGKFQGANQADFSDAVTFFTVPSTPTYSVYTTVMVDNITPFRYLRYLSPNGGHCNVSEVEFYTVAPAAPQGTAAAMIDGTVSISWNTAPHATHYHVKRASASGGPYTTIASNLTALFYQDTGLSAAATYYYIVSASNEVGTSSNSAEATAADSYSQWVQLNGWTVGAPESAFHADHDSNGVHNAAEYMTPAGLNVAPGATESTITALVRQDGQVTTTLLSSLNLASWSEVPFPVAADQSGVPEGYVRHQAIVTVIPSEPNKFYRLQFTR